MRLRRRALLLMLGCACALALGCHPGARPDSPRPQRARPLFEFRSDVWLNLHLRLYREAMFKAGKPGRGAQEPRPPPLLLAAAEAGRWDAAVDHYATPGYEPYADRFGLYKRGEWGAFREVLAARWTPHLEGRLSVAEAAAAIAAAFEEDAAGPPAQ